MTLFLTASSFYSIFTQVPKTFNSSVALQEVSWSVLRHSSSGLSLSPFLHVTPDRLMMIRSDLKHLTALLQLMAKWMFGNVNWYFLLTQDRYNWLKPILLAGENTSFLITTVFNIYFLCANKCWALLWLTGRTCPIRSCERLMETPGWKPTVNCTLPVSPGPLSSWRWRRPQVSPSARGKNT